MRRGREPYREHLRSSADLVTPYEAIRAGFVALALEKNRRATPFVEQARALKAEASRAKTPNELTDMPEIQSAVLTAAGVSDKASAHLQESDKKSRTLLYNITVPISRSHVDICVFDCSPKPWTRQLLKSPASYLALGELKGGIDPAGADEHWKTARTAVSRIHDAFARNQMKPHTIFIGAAIETKMAKEIWSLLESGVIENAANLTDDKQMASITRWLCAL